MLEGFGGVDGDRDKAAEAATDGEGNRHGQAGRGQWIQTHRDDVPCKKRGAFPALSHEPEKPLIFGTHKFSHRHRHRRSGFTREAAVKPPSLRGQARSYLGCVSPWERACSRRAAGQPNSYLAKRDYPDACPERPSARLRSITVTSPNCRTVIGSTWASDCKVRSLSSSGNTPKTRSRAASGSIRSRS